MLPLCLFATSLVPKVPCVPHAIVAHMYVPREEALTCYRRFVPMQAEQTGRVSVAAVESLKKIKRVLEDESSCMFVGDGVCLNAFFCTTHKFQASKRCVVLRNPRPRPRFRPYHRLRHVTPLPKLFHRLDAYIVFDDEGKEGEAVCNFATWFDQTVGKGSLKVN